MASKTLHPVQTLREHATALEAAMTVALAKPDKTAVHEVRTLVRRLEAQMELLETLAKLPADSADAGELRRELRKLRRAAGRVRDLDVQRNNLKTHPGLPRRAALELRDELKDARHVKAEKLQRVLKKQLPKIAAALEQVVASVGTANGMTLPALRLAPLVERWMESREAKLPEEMDDEQLHTMRKVAKSARYMVESAKGVASAEKAAARFEEQQDAGGHWHDWMDLEATSREYFGKKHPLTRAAGVQCKAARTKYVELLAAEK
jgi:CHAD domain-containing protein